MALRWFSRPTFSMTSDQPQLYRELSDGVVLEAGHLLLRRRYFLRCFDGSVFAVDPRTPAFQGRFDNMVEPRTERIRSSYLKLARLHGEAVWKRFKRMEAPSPRHFGKESCRTMVENLLELELDSGAQALIPPYFAFSAPTDGWMDLTLRLYDAMEAASRRIEVYLPLAFDHELLSREKFLDLLIDTVQDLEPRGTAIWPVGLNEPRAMPEELVGLSYLIRSLSGDVLLMYGGFFSRVLSAAFSASLVAGPCFFERRGLDVCPPLEFMPKCRYYVPELKMTLDPTLSVSFYEVLEAMDVEPDLCRACLRYVDGNGLEGLTEMADIDVFEHNLLTKRQELVHMSLCNDPVADALERLLWIDRNRRFFSPIHGLGHVKKWIAALSSIDREGW